MQQRDISRRTALKGGAAALSGLTVVHVAGPAQAFPAGGPGSVVVPWLDQPEPIPPPARDVVGNLLVWEDRLAVLHRRHRQRPVDRRIPAQRAAPSATTG